MDSTKVENAFLPTDNDKLRAQIKELRVRLAVATEKRKKLKKQIIEEDLSYLVVSKITEAIKDPTRLQDEQLDGIQKQIFEQLISTAEECTVQEMISYHRLAGRTVFNFSKYYQGIRLETFYNKRYREPYYLLFLNNDVEADQPPKKVEKHTIPKFIPVESLAARFLPYNMETFLRIVHDLVQAFVSRREFLNELINDLEILSPNIEVVYRNGSNTKVEFKLESFDDKPPIKVTMLFNNYASSFPTDINVRDFDDTQGTHDYSMMEQELLLDNIIDVFVRFTGKAPLADNDVTEDMEDVLEGNDTLEEPMDTFANSGGEVSLVKSESTDMKLD